MNESNTSGVAKMGDTTYNWLSTAIGDILYATRASGHRDRLLMGTLVRRTFELLSTLADSEPLEQLRREQSIVEQARDEEAALQEKAREDAEREQLHEALDAGTLTPEAYVRALSGLVAGHNAPASVEDRLKDHRILAKLEQDLRVGRVGDILDSRGSERSPGTDDALLGSLEALWQDEPTRPPTTGSPSWADRPHGQVPDATLRRQLSWLKRAIPHLLDQADHADAQAEGLRRDAERGDGPAARAARQAIESGRSTANADRAATASFHSANAHLRRSLALHQAADDAQHRAHAGTAHLLLRGTTSRAQQDRARRLRVQADLAKDEADAALADATASLTRARALRSTSPDPQHRQAANQTLEPAVESDVREADASATHLRAAAAQLRAKAASYQDRLEQLAGEAVIRSLFDPVQRAADDRERAARHRKRLAQEAPGRAGQRAQRQSQTGRGPNQSRGTGPSPA